MHCYSINKYIESNKEANKICLHESTFDLIMCFGEYRCVKASIEWDVISSSIWEARQNYCHFAGGNCIKIDVTKKMSKCYYIGLQRHIAVKQE